MPLEISQNSQEDICAIVFFKINLQPLGLLIVLLNNIAHAVLYWSQLIPFYQRLSWIIFKICFSRSCSPSRVTRHILEILLACRHTLVAQNCGMSVSLHHWRNWCLLLDFSFIIFYWFLQPTELIETIFFYFGTCFITAFKSDK